MNQEYTGTLLIVDDEPELVSVLKEIFTDLNYDVQTAKDGHEALDCLKAKIPDAILSDINMPKMSGIELIYEVRKMGIEIPCVLLTAHMNFENIMKALRIGVTDFLEKPFQIAELKVVLNNAVNLGIEIKKLERELDQICDQHGIDADSRQRFKRFKLSLMIMGSHPTSPFNKAG